MKLLFIIFFIICHGNRSDLLEKLDNVISGSNLSNSLRGSNLNDLKTTEDISDSIKDLLDESAEKNNKENLKSVVNSIHAELADKKNEISAKFEKNSKKNGNQDKNGNIGLGSYQNNLRSSFSFLQNKSKNGVGQNFSNNIRKNPTTISQSSSNLKKSVQIDPYELTLKIMQYSKDRIRNQDLNSQLNINSAKSSSGYFSVSKPTNNDIIFEHIYINLNGDKKLPNTNSNFIYDQVKNEFIVPEDSKKNILLNLLF
jgi:hypothetical protein